MSIVLGAMCHAVARLMIQVVLTLVFVFICVLAAASGLTALKTVSALPWPPPALRSFR